MPRLRNGLGKGSMDIKILERKPTQKVLTRSFGWGELTSSRSDMKLQSGSGKKSWTVCMILLHGIGIIVDIFLKAD
jgi:hypothetical protein